MVHALHETHRVLKADGLLVDIRPGVAHRQVGLLTGRRWKHVATMREHLDSDRAANSAVRVVIEQSLFRPDSFVRIDLKRHIGTLRNLSMWLEDFATLVDFPPHDWMVRQVTEALSRSSGAACIVARGPVEVRSMRKLP